MQTSRYLRLVMASVVMLAAASGAHALTCAAGPTPPLCDLGNQTATGVTVGNSAGAAVYGAAPYAEVTDGDQLSFKGVFSTSSSFNTTWYFTTSIAGLFLDGASFVVQGINDFTANLYDSSNNLIQSFTAGTVYYMIPLTNLTTLSGVDTFHFIVTGTPGTQTPRQYSFNGSIVPLPAAAWLLLSGVAGLGAMARRRKVAAEAA